MSDIDTKIDKLIDLVAHVESGGDYSKWNHDDNGAGVSWGLIQFNQQKGSLGELIHRMMEADHEVFLDAFVRSPFDLVRKSPGVGVWEIDRAAVRAMDLSGFENEFRTLGEHPPFQAIQRDLAREEYFEPAAKLCAKHGLESERAHAMAFDVAVQYGPGGLAKMLEKAERQTSHEVFMDRSKEKQILIALARLADTHNYDHNRRHNLLKSTALSDGPMFPPQRPTLRQGQPHGGYLKELQESLVRLKYMTPAECRGDFGPWLRMAVRAFQKDSDLTPDAIVGPLTWAALDKALADKGGTP